SGRIDARVACSIRDSATRPITRISRRIESVRMRNVLVTCPFERRASATPAAETATKKRLVLAAEVDHVLDSSEVRWLYSALRILNLSSRSSVRRGELLNRSSEENAPASRTPLDRRGTRSAALPRRECGRRARRRSTPTARP